MAILGIDTSNYRTSLCLINHDYQTLQEVNPLLEVKAGELGLQQSRAVFEHIKAWPALLQSLDQRVKVEAVGVSTKPRPIDDSYMPVFKVGEVLAETIAYFLSIPLYKTSHQEGHIAAGEYSSLLRPEKDRFIAVHLSGGTSEVLLCQRLHSGYQIDRLGGSLDLHAGQFVDRVGVRLGLPFPAGPQLEKLALEAETEQDLPVIPSYTDGINFSFSGPATSALRFIETDKYKPSDIARAVEKTIAKTLEKSLKAAISRTKVKEVMLVGGVASNAYIMNRLKKKLEHPAIGASIYLSSPQYATDNAYGVACIALNHFKNEQ